MLLLGSSPGSGLSRCIPCFGGGEQMGGFGAQNSTTGQGLTWRRMVVGGSKTTDICTALPKAGYLHGSSHCRVAENYSGFFLFQASLRKGGEQQLCPSTSFCIWVSPTPPLRSKTKPRTGIAISQVGQVCHPHKIRVILGRRWNAPENIRQRRWVYFWEGPAPLININKILHLVNTKYQLLH